MKKINTACPHKDVNIHFPIHFMNHNPNLETTHVWLNKSWYICPAEYHSAIRRDELLKYPTTWMDLKMITLS